MVPAVPDLRFPHEIEPGALDHFVLAAKAVRAEEERRAEDRLDRADQPTNSFPPVCIPRLSNISAAVRNRIVWLFCWTAKVARKIGTRRSCPKGTPNSGWPVI
jgi:hypothetical protein